MSLPMSPLLSARCFSGSRDPTPNAEAVFGLRYHKEKVGLLEGFVIIITLPPPEVYLYSAI
jgi:hypothetical protein